MSLNRIVVSLINIGSAFHKVGAANTKARSPRVALTLIFGKLSKIPSLELLKLYIDTGLEIIKSFNTKVQGP